MPAALTLLPGGLTEPDPLQSIAEKSPHHPALRWTPHWAPDQRAQHRRNRDGTGTSCGIITRLSLAVVDDPPCRDCFPTKGS